MEVQIIPAKIEFTLEQLNYALREVYELWNYWEYMLMGDTAKGAKEGKLYGDKIEIGIPVECRVIHRNYQFFKFPDTVVYNYDEFKTPNPLEKSYRARFIVR